MQGDSNSEGRRTQQEANTTNQHTRPRMATVEQIGHIATDDGASHARQYNDHTGEETKLELRLQLNALRYYNNLLSQL